MEIIWQCEIDPYCRKVLAKHWPDVHCYEDVRELDETTPKVDLICGGFPCQPVSTAGKRQAEADSRWLWPEFARVIGLLRPRYVLVENVPGLLTKGMGFVLADLSSLGYDAGWGCVSAADVGAPHLRNRVFIIAHTDSGCDVAHAPTDLRRADGKSVDGCEETSGEPPSERAVREGYGAARDDGLAEGREAVADSASRGRIAQSLRCSGTQARNRTFDADCSSTAIREQDWWKIEPNVGRMAHGVPARVDRLRGLGNAVVPQVAEYVGRQIMRIAGHAQT
jgi:DNA (cytosine-5)-methyltransferase 1